MTSLIAFQEVNGNTFYRYSSFVIILSSLAVDYIDHYTAVNGFLHDPKLSITSFCISYNSSLNKLKYDGKVTII